MSTRSVLKLRKSFGLSVVLLIAIALFAVWTAGTLLISPHRCGVPKPEGFQAEDVEFTDTYGDRIKCWWLPTDGSSPTVIVVHGIGANRLAMVGRANFFRKLGYGVFLFDLPAHGESGGDRVSFGLHEGAAVSGALGWVRAHTKNRRVGVDGVSLGGAGVLLRARNSGFDAVILEAVFPDIHRALLNRLTDRFGILGYVLEPPFLAQLIVRLREMPQSLSPTNRIQEIHAPVLVIGGEQDHLTKIEETKELFAHAADPKELWTVPECGHDDFFAKRPLEYAAIVGNFLHRYLAE